MRTYLTHFFGALDRLLFPPSQFPERYQLHLNIPEEFKLPREKIIYALAHDGTQCKPNLALLTQLGFDEISPALEELEALDIVRRRPCEFSIGSDETDCFDTYALNTEKRQPNL